MIAKDSPLRIDCPPAKHGAISSTHASLDAAIAKFRVTAYMWQAQVAEDLRAKGLGRRSFRLEEEWSHDTLSEHSLHQHHKRVMNAVPRVYLIRTDKTVSELRDIEVAQQNPNPRGRQDELHQIFSNALQAHGPPFTSESRPVVAGLILDAHYDIDTKIILGHAALGCHNPEGLSLGIFGSHTTYSWPRFLEEVPDCLLDTAPPGDTVSNDNKECNSMWETCAVGQGAFLHEVGHAFSAPHTTGIMARGYSPDWPKAFISRTAYSLTHNTEGTSPVKPETSHGCVWDVRDALRFRNLPHFWLPGDVPLDVNPPAVDVLDHDGKGEDTDDMSVEIACESGIVDLRFDKKTSAECDLGVVLPSISQPAKSLRISRSQLAKAFELSSPLSLEVTGLNGKRLFVDNVWGLMRSREVIRVPGSDILLFKQVVGYTSSDGNADTYGRSSHEWGVMLKKRNKRGKLVPANMIDIRVGCALDGAVVYYKDGTSIPCGPRGQHMGGHQHRNLRIPDGVEVVKVAVCRYNTEFDGSLSGLRMWLSNGKAMGALNVGYSSSGKRDKAVDILGMFLLPSLCSTKHHHDANLFPVPPANHKIIGFIGSSFEYGMCQSFGIVTAPKDVDLPDSVYDLEELQNNTGAAHDARRSSKKRKFDEVCDQIKANFWFNPFVNTGAQEVHDNKSESDVTMEDHWQDDDDLNENDDDYDDGWDDELERIYQREGWTQ